VCTLDVMRVVVLLALVGCGEKALSMTIALPEDKERWDTSCLASVEVYTVGPNYPETDDYVGQTIEVSGPATYDDMQSAIRGEFDVDIPDSGLHSMEMYGWNGPPAWDGATSELVFYSRVVYQGEDTVTIPLVPNLDCRTSPVVVRPIDLITLVTTKSCAMAAVADGQMGVVSAGTLSPGLYEPYLFGWGGAHSATVVGGVSRMNASTTVGPQTCLAWYAETATGFSGGCATGFKACASGSEYEVAIVDDQYALNSLDPTIQRDFVGAVFGAVVDGAKNPIAGATVEVPAELGKVVYVNLDVAAKRLVPVSGAATTASGMFIVYTSDIVEVKITSAGATKTAVVGAQREDGDTLPAGLVVPF
jgi:hypothetical protein